MIKVKSLKTTKGLSASRLPKIERRLISPNRDEYMQSNRSLYLSSQGFIYKIMGWDAKHCFVYILWIKDEIVYVGQSKSVVQRLQSHKSRIKYTHVSLLNFEDNKTMKSAEIRLIQKHRPVYNKLHNPDCGYIIYD